MNGIALLIAISSLGVDYSWRTTAEGDVEYVLQVEPAFIQALIDGEEIHSDVPAEAGKAQRVVLRIDTKELPKTAADAQRARSLLRGQNRVTGEYTTVLWRAGKTPEETAAVTYGWQPDAQGQLLYYLQIDPALLKTLNSGDEIHATIRPEAGRAATFAVAAGVKQLPRVAGNSAAAANQPATAGPATAPPATSPPATAYDMSGRRRFNSLSDPGTSPEPSRASTARAGTSSSGTALSGTTSSSTAPSNTAPSNQPPLYSPRTADTADSRSTALEPATGSSRTRWSATDTVVSPIPQPLEPTVEQPAPRAGYAFDPPPIQPKPQDGRELYPAPAPAYAMNPEVQPGENPLSRPPLDAPRFDAPRDFSTAGAGAYPPADNRFQPSQNEYRGSVPPASAGQTGFDYSQPPADRISSRTPNAPLGIARPLPQDSYPNSAAATPTAFGAAPPLQNAVPPTAAAAQPLTPPAATQPAPEAKPVSQPLSAWTLLWCLVFFSVGGNFYLGWTAAEFYSRYKLATERLRSGSRA